MEVLEMEIIRKREKVIRAEWALEWEGPEGRGYRFDCDEYGIVETKTWEDEAFKSYRLCITGKMKGYKGPFLNKREYRDIHCAVGKCGCGQEVYLHYHLNRCKCGAQYNKLGQMLESSARSLLTEIPRNEMEDA
jgi:hypothetical protein